MRLPKAVLVAGLGAASLACGATSRVHTDAVLGKVVVYKSGIAYFERSAVLDEDVLRLSVPPDRVDDLFKSLTVVDARTGEPAAVAYPSGPGAASEDGLVDLEVGLTGPRPHRVRLSYVTEAPAWKPTYRILVGAGGKVRLEGWAIVDNASGEDWTQIKLGVGSSSALSFRYDLRSLRIVARETLHPTGAFALAPPTGRVTHDGAPALLDAGTSVLAEIGDGSGTPASREAPARSAVQRSEEIRARIVRQLDQARSQKDVVRILCINDKLSSVDATLRAARRHEAELAAARLRNDDGAVIHQNAVLATLQQRAAQLAVETNQCVGAESGFVGGSAVTTTIDPSLPPDEEDPRPFVRNQPDPAPVAATTPAPPAPSRSEPPKAGDIPALARSLQSSSRRIRIEGFAAESDGDGVASSLERARLVRETLVGSRRAR